MSFSWNKQRAMPTASLLASAARRLKTAAVAALILSTSLSAFAADLKSAEAGSSNSQGLAAICGPYRIHSPLCQALLAARTAHSSPGNNARSSTTDAVAEGLAKSKNYQFASADFPGASASIVLGRNANTLVGYFSSGPTGLASYIVKGGVYEEFSVPFTVRTYLNGINASGDMVGGFIDGAGNEHGFFYMASSGSFTNLDVPGAIFTTAGGINNSDQIVGYYVDSASNQHGFLYAKGVYTTIDFPGASLTNAYGINSAGDIVGLWTAGSSDHGFLRLHDGSFTDVEFPGANSTGAWGINDKGQLAGSFIDGGEVQHGFIYAYKTGSWTQVDVPLAADTSVEQIENNGKIAGFYLDAPTQPEFHGYSAQ